MARYTSVIAINSSVFLLMLGVGMIVALLPARIIDLSGSISNVGVLASAYAASFVLLQLPIGRLSDRFGFKPFLVGGYFLCALTGLLYYFSGTPNLIFFGRMLHGVGEIPIMALAPALLSVQFPGEKGKFIGMYNASLHIGLTLGCTLGVWTARAWRGGEAFLFFAAASLLGGLLVALLAENTPGKARAATAPMDRGSVRSLARIPAVGIALFGVALYGAGYGVFITIIPAFLISVKSGDQTLVGVFFALFYVSISLAQLIGGPLSDRGGRKPAMAYGLLMATIGLAAFFHFQPPWLLAFLVLASLGLGVFGVSSMAFLNDYAPGSLKGTVSGAYYFSWGAGYFIGPLVLGKVSHFIGFQTAFIVLAGLFMMELVAFTLTVLVKWKAPAVKY
ncbi:MAG: MFS transporter [Desulfobacterales bacterium]|nr:MFS transporter [Desulfobacterales bacterium]